MNSLISICIPTYNRPVLLAEALRSCVTQSYADLEIVVGDDSSDARSEDVCERFRAECKGALSYKRHIPGLGQNANVNELFARAAGDRVLLLHDDDRLLPDAIAMLANPWQQHPELLVSFGRQAIISADGTRDDDETERLNAEFERVGPSRPIETPIVAGLLQQFPNNAFLIARELARTVGYRSNEEIGGLCDVDFGVRACLRMPSHTAYYVNALVAEYRRHDASISRSNANRKAEHPAADLAFYDTVRELELPPQHEFARQRVLSRFVERRVKGLALSGDRVRALSHFASRYYGWRRRLSSKGLYHLALILAPGLERARRYD